MVNAVGYIRISAFRIHIFHLFYSLGFLVALSSGFALASLLELQWWVIASLCAVSAVTFFSLVKLVKQWSGRENIVYYHHEIGILLASLLVLFIIRQPVLPYLDITITGIGIFNIFGRLGCFLVGCCHGKPCRVGVTYHHGHVQQGFPFYYENVRLFPIQLVESSGAFLLVLACMISVLSDSYQPGEIIVLYSLLYGFGRFVLEIFRGDADRSYWAGISEAQWTSLAVTATTTILGYLGLLPLYTWHLIIFGMLMVMSVGVLLFHRLNTSHRYLHPVHVQELATALFSMKQRNLNVLDPESLDLSVYTTQPGITVSYSCDSDNSGTCYIYGVSGKRPINRKIAGKLGTMIAIVNHHHGPREVLYDGKGTYYIIFEEKNQIV